MFYMGAKPSITQHLDQDESYVIPANMYAIVVADPAINAPVTIGGSSVATSPQTGGSGSATFGFPSQINVAAGISGFIKFSISNTWGGGDIQINGSAFATPTTPADYEVRVVSGMTVRFEVASGQMDYTYQIVGQDFGNGNDRLKKASAGQTVAGACTIYAYFLP